MRRTGLAILLVAAVSLGCASRIAVEVVSDEDFSGYRTWDWLPRGGPSLVLGPQVAPDTDMRLARLIEDGLEARGYPRVEPGQAPDFYVTYHFELGTEQYLRRRPHAQNTLHSGHNTGANSTYTVEQSSDPYEITYEVGTLVLDIADGRERQLVWRVQRRESVRGSFAPRLEVAVEDLISRVPEPGE